MDWTELVVTASRGEADAAVAVCTAACDGGLYIEDYADLETQVRAMAHVDLIEQALLDEPRDIVKIHLYYSPDENAAEVAEALRSRLLAAGVQATLATASVRQQDWENAWKQYYHPLEIGRRLAIAPSWEPYTGTGRTVLTLDPGMAFGTGTHETTALCLGVLDERVKGGERVLDVGCGSGILAVAALLLGAGEALGIDIDKMAVRTARENAERNGVQARFTALAGNLAGSARGRYNIVCANIVADAILRLAPDIPPLLAKDGTFIASGIIDTRKDEVQTGLKAAGLQVQQVLEDNGWVALVCGLPPQHPQP